MIKLDLHLHSHYSGDATGTPRDIIRFIQKRKLNGLSITDHNTTKGSLEAIKIKPKNLIVIPGVEVSTREGHLIALNVEETIPPHLPLIETIEIIFDKGGIPIVPHLFRNLSGIKKDRLLKIKDKIDAIEVYNACSLPTSNLKTAKIAKELKLGGVGGSDSHEPRYAGYAYTILDTTDNRVDTIIEEILKRRTWGIGETLPLSYRKSRMIKSVKQFFQRGFKRI